MRRMEGQKKRPNICCRSNERPFYRLVVEVLYHVLIVDGSRLP